MPNSGKLSTHLAEIALHLGSGVGGRQIAREFSAKTRAGIRLALPELAPGIAVLAQGGLARDEQIPYSDVDLLFLIRDESYGPEVETSLYALWDAGYVLGYAVRTISEAVGTLGRDPDAVTALLEATHLTGDEKLSRSLLQNFNQRLTTSMRGWLREAKKNELEERRERFGASVHLVEPNIKHSPGALRDLHSLFWVGMLRLPRKEGADQVLQNLLRAGLLLDREFAELNRCWDELLSIRLALRLVARRAEDRLLFEYQEPMAQILSVAASVDMTSREEMMRHYFRIALRNRRTVDDVLQRIGRLEAIPMQASKSRAVEDVFFIKAGRLFTYDPELFSKAPQRMVDLLRVSEEENTPIAARTRTQLFGLLDREKHARWHDDTRFGAALLRLCKSRSVHGTPFTRLLDAGVLGVALADMERLEGRFKQDGYHAYATDAHICRATDFAIQVASGALPPPPTLAPIVERTTRFHLLVLGALFHDIAKGRGGDHAELGVETAIAEARRMGLPPEERRVLAFLVKHHLTLSRASQRRDLGDPQEIAKLASVVRTPERLDLLALLTWVDINAVAPNMFNSWKAELLGAAVEKVRAALLDPAGAEWTAEEERASRDEAEKTLLEHFPGQADAIADFVTGASVRGLNTRDDVELHADFRAYGFFRDRNESIVIFEERQDDDSLHIRVVSADRPGLLADLATGFYRLGLNVQMAYADAREDKIGLDAFRADDGHGRVPESNMLDSLEETLLAAAVGEIEQRITLGDTAMGPEIPVRVSAIAEQDQWGATIFDLSSRERPGLLAAVSRVFSNAGWDIVLSKILGDGDRFRATFYVDAQEGALDIQALRAKIAARMKE